MPTNQNKSPNKLLVDYLIHSYIYYSKGTSLITDFEFDSIAHQLRDVFDRVDHPHKRLVNLDSLKVTTSAFYITEDQYPGIVKSVAEKLIKKEIKLC
jgi:hypothetical protein